MKYFITAAIPYVNAKPHIGHALEFVQGDVIARYHRILGHDTLYLCGADENALKIVQAAEKAGMEVLPFCDANANLFQSLMKKLDVQLDIFERASSESHHISSKKLWELCEKNGDIYKKAYQGLYCVGCEAFYTQEELNENGECFEHPGKKLDVVTEENYFFRLSRYKNQILKLIESDGVHVVSEIRKNEMIGFLNGDVQDISISRSRERARNWGVEVPKDPSQMMYVWFDALNVYQSGVGFGTDEKQYNTWWPADAHLIGKGILRFHAVYWIAMLLSAGLSLPKEIFVHGYITIGGQKMSKTLGNVIDPLDLIQTFDIDPLRYYFLREMSSIDDADFTIERMSEVYQAHLANELGNLVSRLAKLCESLPLQIFEVPTSFTKQVAQYIVQFALKNGIDHIWDRIVLINKTLTDTKPWEKDEKEKITLLAPLVQELIQVGYDLQPFLPNTAEKIMRRFAGSRITASEPLFPKRTS
ncbi:MAG: methionine--tRNA ligase [Candidatus Pacebacteria bacterium]|nr:methionine--tRNA ligase [Candidatus Paceibacterota bacterium]